MYALLPFLPAAVLFQTAHLRPPALWQLSSFMAHERESIDSYARSVGHQAKRSSFAAHRRIDQLASPEDNESTLAYDERGIGPSISSGSIVETTQPFQYVIPFGNIPLGLDHGERATQSIFPKWFRCEGDILFPTLCFSNADGSENTTPAFFEHQDVTAVLYWDPHVSHQQSTVFVPVYNNSAMLPFSPSNMFVDTQAAMNPTYASGGWSFMNNSRKTSAPAQDQIKILHRWVIDHDPSAAQQLGNIYQASPHVSDGGTMVTEQRFRRTNDLDNFTVATVNQSYTRRHFQLEWRVKGPWRQEYDDAGNYASEGRLVLCFYVRQWVRLFNTVQARYGSNFTNDDFVKARMNVRRGWSEPQS